MMIPKDKKYIRTGFFEAFKGEDSILIATDTYGLAELEEFFNRLAGGLGSAQMNQLKYTDMRHCLDITALCGSADTGMVRTDDGRYEWTLSAQKWREFKEKAAVLHRSGSGYNYLDSGSPGNKDLQVVLSLNEPVDYFIHKQ